VSVRTILVLAVAALAAAPDAVAAQAKPAGSLDQLAGRNGCLYDPRGGSAQGIRVNLPGRCGRAAALDGAYEAVASPDGRHLYVASFSGDTLSVFVRNPATGRLTQPAGAAGCVIDGPFQSRCAGTPALDGPSGLAISPDGRHVYVGLYATHGVAAFARNRTSGALTPLPGSDACVSEGVNERECARGTALFGAGAVAVSPDGRHVYVASFWSDAIAVFARDAAGGALRQLEGRDGCARDPIWVEEDTALACTVAPGIEGPSALALSGDGRHVYVAAFGAGGLGVLQRDPASGRLTALPGLAACFNEDVKARPCTEARSVGGAFAVTVSRDGRNVYLASGFDRRDGAGGAFAGSGVAVFARAQNGRVRQLAGRAGCVNEAGRQGCTDGRALEGAQAVVVSPDGRNVYVAAAASDAIAVFSRDPQTGRITQLAGRAGCLSDHGTRGLCRVATGLWGVSAVVVSPDGRHAYAPGFFSSAIAVFQRAPLPRSGR
jgi:DNA-binding beta-propeller fold protein YncE